LLQTRSSAETVAFIIRRCIEMLVGGIFCGSAKSFDCVNYEIFLVKLHNFGFQGIAANWFRSYLINRKQKTEIKSENSKTQSFQGSILGPLLFIIYINYLPPTINTLIRAHFIH